MFEQAVLPSHPAGGRYWTTIAGFSAELLVIGLALLAPLIWTDFLPRVEALNWISLPAPPAAASKPLPERVVRPTHPWQTVGNILLRPTVIPPTALLIEDPPGAVPGGSASDGVQVPAGAGVLATLLDSLAHAVPPQRVAAPAVVAQPAPAAPAAPRRISALQPARLLHRVEPVYPLLARTARISGTVELMGVIAADGRIRELRLVRGHPLLAQAALDAVRQWIYEPTVLNGEAVEVAAPIKVEFILK